jgi:hypothetical protein
MARERRGEAPRFESPSDSYFPPREKHKPQPDSQAATKLDGVISKVGWGDWEEIALKY